MIGRWPPAALQLRPRSSSADDCEPPHGRYEACPNLSCHHDEMNLWDLSDLSTPWCVHVVATLRIANHIEAGNTDIDTLAIASGVDRESLQRVLRQLVSKGLFEEPAPGRFALNEAARGLLDETVLLG